MVSAVTHMPSSDRSTRYALNKHALAKSSPVGWPARF
jgi:hypothetical protein